MKRFLLGLLVFQLFTFAANAQIQKGSIMLGGSMNYSSGNTEDYYYQTQNTNNRRYKEFRIEPKIGYSIAENWIVGVSFLANTYKSKIEINNSNPLRSSETINYIFGGSVFAKKYFSLSDKFSAFGGIDFGPNWSKNENSQTDGNSDPTSITNTQFRFTGSLSTGLAFFPKNWLAIELSTNFFAYTHISALETEDYSTSGPTNSWRFNLDATTLNLGVSFFLNNK
ncbi:hypothetical protein [Algoriphagus winogradskyi]|uniref:Opacity protein n=1 Tax=Algoriphagus winogradskyi TaxID=237017 RepID=A0ABY1NQG1_9BACT|nr:hypothetical protein [Algoriphagus winogradskyi]SMP14728.1 Opacity protein [Algoriphagus winogradskyi]